MLLGSHSFFLFCNRKFSSGLTKHGSSLSGLDHVDIEDELTGAKMSITRAQCTNIPDPVVVDGVDPPPPEIKLGFSPAVLATMPPFVAQRMGATKFVVGRNFDTILLKQPLAASDARSDPVLHRGYTFVFAIIHTHRILTQWFVSQSCARNCRQSPRFGSHH